MVASKFNELASKFQQMSISSVKFIAYDANLQNQAPRIETQEVPTIYLMPAYKKSPPSLRFLGSPKVSEMGAFLKKHADIKFEMSANLEQMEQFQEMQIKQMVEERQRQDQMKMIEDELRRRGEL